MCFLRDWWDRLVAKTVTVKARGLFLNPNDLGAVPDGALLQAELLRDGAEMGGLLNRALGLFQHRPA